MLPWVLWLLVFGTAVFFAYTFWIEPRRLVVDSLALELPDLPPELEGLRLVHLSDLHCRERPGHFSEQMARRAVQATLEAEPDLVCLTGDLGELSRSGKTVAELLAPLADLTTLVVMGNHDHDRILEHQGSAQPLRHLTAAQWQAAMQAVGLIVLHNEHLTLELRGRRVVVAGVGDPSCGWDDLPRALEGAPAGDLRLILVHSPDLVDDPRSDWAHVLLCGHTHGGQIRLPGIGTPWAPVWRDRRRSAGLLRIGGVLCHVSRGVGAGVRNRFLCPPQVAVLTLTRQGGTPAVVLPRLAHDLLPEDNPAPLPGN